MSYSDLWIRTFKPNPKAKLRLYCFPYAGAGTLVFRRWASELPPEIEVSAVQLPGRETRFKESPLTELPHLVSMLTGIFYPYRLDRSFALFGHSLGALIAFELARNLAKQYKVTPAHLFASARIAPHTRDPRGKIYTLSDSAFKAKLRELNGTPEEVLDNPEMAPILATLRADFALNENYMFAAGEPLDTPISAYGGHDDPRVNEQELSAWEIHTRKAFHLRQFPGDHFFIETARPLVLKTIAQELASEI
jgi:medium-chain acyl-[acyl-carrier-protein] hydrolase